LSGSNPRCWTKRKRWISSSGAHSTSIALRPCGPGHPPSSRTANQYQGAVSNIQIASLIYLALILLAITFITNYSAQRVVKRFEFNRAGRE